MSMIARVRKNKHKYKYDSEEIQGKYKVKSNFFEYNIAHGLHGGIIGLQWLSPVITNY